MGSCEGMPGSGHLCGLCGFCDFLLAIQLSHIIYSFRVVFTLRIVRRGTRGGADYFERLILLIDHSIF